MQCSSIYLKIICILVLVTSCEKNKLKYNPSASIIITNAIVGGSDVRLNTSAVSITKVYNSQSFGIIPGNDIALYGINDSTKPYYFASQKIIPGGVYSVFLAGQLPAIDAIFVKDISMPYYVDSTIGVRIINLSPNSSPLNITLAADTTKNIFFKIAYKQLTDILKLPLKSVVPAGSVTFQVRDNTSNAILTTYTLPSIVNSTYPNISTVLSCNRNFTLVIKGLQGTTTGVDLFGIFPVANY